MQTLLRTQTSCLWRPEYLLMFTAQGAKWYLVALRRYQSQGGLWVKLQILYSEELRRRKETWDQQQASAKGGKTQGMKSQFTWDDLIEGLSGEEPFSRGFLNKRVIGFKDAATEWMQETEKSSVFAVKYLRKCLLFNGIKCSERWLQITVSAWVTCCL